MDIDGLVKLKQMKGLDRSGVKVILKKKKKKKKMMMMLQEVGQPFPHVQLQGSR